MNKVRMGFFVFLRNGIFMGKILFLFFDSLMNFCLVFRKCLFNKKGEMLN